LTGAYVYVVGDSDKVAIRPVLASTWFGSQWIVDSGIKGGDRVVVDGTQKIFPGAKVAPVPYAGDTTSQAAPAPVPAAPAIPLGSGRQ
jgi:membrane fusion protein (multidrug efflux system)